MDFFQKMQFYKCHSFEMSNLQNSEILKKNSKFSKNLKKILKLDLKIKDSKISLKILRSFCLKV